MKQGLTLLLHVIHDCIHNVHRRPIRTFNKGLEGHHNGLGVVEMLMMERCAMLEVVMTTYSKGCCSTDLRPCMMPAVCITCCSHLLWASPQAAVYLCTLCRGSSFTPQGWRVCTLMLLYVSPQAAAYLCTPCRGSSFTPRGWRVHGLMITLVCKCPCAQM